MRLWYENQFFEKQIIKKMDQKPFITFGAVSWSVLTFSLAAPCWAGDNTDLTSNSNISKTVGFLQSIPYAFQCYRGW